MAGLKEWASLKELRGTGLRLLGWLDFGWILYYHSSQKKHSPFATPSLHRRICPGLRWTDLQWGHCINQFLISLDLLDCWHVGQKKECSSSYLVFHCLRHSNYMLPPSSASIVHSRVDIYIYILNIIWRIQQLINRKLVLLSTPGRLKSGLNRHSHTQQKNILPPCGGFDVFRFDVFRWVIFSGHESQGLIN